MFNHFLERTQALFEQREPFALAYVVRRQIPSSGKPGDKAVIEKNGRITGWIGGGCTRGIIAKEAMNAMTDGKPRFVRISPEGNTLPADDIIDYKMTCHSGGSVEVYIEPILPRPQLLILGKSHVAMAISRLGKAMDYPVNVVAPNADKTAFPDADQLITDRAFESTLIRPNSCIIVCTQGENDEDALEGALRSGAPYICFVASRRKANAVFQVLRQRGVSFDELQRVRTPAGLDINAKLPEEVGISILAEIVAFIRAEDSEFSSASTDVDATADSDIYINPVCGIPVSKSSAKHVIEHEGESYYFCCDGCKVSFEKNPAQYATVS